MQKKFESFSFIQTLVKLSQVSLPQWLECKDTYRDNHKLVYKTGVDCFYPHSLVESLLMQNKIKIPELN